MLLLYATEPANTSAGPTFSGRFGTYRYLNMDVTIREAMDTAEAGTAMPAFVKSPI